MIFRKMKTLYVTDHTERYRKNTGSEQKRKPEMKLEVEILSFIDGEHKEELEDGIKEFLKGYGVTAKIYSSTGNEITVNPFYNKR